MKENGTISKKASLKLSVTIKVTVIVESHAIRWRHRLLHPGVHVIPKNLEAELVLFLKYTEKNYSIQIKITGRNTF